MNETLALADVTKYFGGYCAVSHVHLQIRSERIHSVIGPNGAGKTTLFNLIAGTISPNSGQIFFGDKEVTKVPHYLRARMGIARSFQITNIFPDFTVFENIRLAIQSLYIGGFHFIKGITKYNVIKDRAEEILEFVKLTHLRDQEAGTLSHSDQRNLEIGIAWALRPKLILLDEPTSGMSRKEIPFTINLIKKISESVHVLLVEHKMDIVMAISDRITVLNQGQAIATGNPEEIKAHPEVRKAYLGD